MKQAEILAPAGSMESLLAAVHSGADAVYFGYGPFNARRNAKNFDEASFAQMARLCKARGVKLYMTLNTLLFDRELEQLKDSVQAACRNGVDAILVQDLGVLHLLRQWAPEIPLHASTQMAVHNVSGARQLYEMGFSRVVLAREMSRQEIRAVVEQVPVEVEIFVHGALCMSLSGQCYMSSVIGERSGNRGLCAQPCRLPSSSGRGDNGYALSLKDLTLADRVQQLQELGVDSFKIEGRMKRPEYVAAAVGGFRRALAGEKPDLEQMEAAFSRSGFTRGYFDGKLGLEMFGVRQKEDVLASQKVLGKLAAQLEKEYPSVPLNLRFSLRAGEPAQLLAWDDKGHQVLVQGPVPEAAQNRPTTPELVRRSMEKLGGSFYYLSELDCQLDPGLILPASQLNQLRRQALEQLTEQRSVVEPWPFHDAPVPAQPKLLRLYDADLRAQLRSIKQLTPLMEKVCSLITLPLAEAERHWERLQQLGERLCVTLPRVTFGDDAAQLEQRLLALREKGLKHLSVGNIGGIYLGRRLGFVLHGEASLNITNSLALGEYAALGLGDAVASFELNQAQLRSLGDRLPHGFVAYGRLPLMLCRNCPIRLGGCKDCKGQGTLTDRKGQQFPVACQGRQYSEVFNSRPLYLADCWEQWRRDFPFAQLLFTLESPEQVDRILRAYTETFEPLEGCTRGLYNRRVK